MASFLDSQHIASAMEHSVECCQNALGRNGFGYHEYSCPKCGSKKRIPHTCKSRFCSSCGKVATDKWVETSLSQLLDVEYKHLVFTLPEQFRDWFLQNRSLP